MSRIIVLELAPSASPPRPRASPVRCGQWLRDLERSGPVIAVPEIADYELRRELIRSGATAGIGRLDAFETTADYLPITGDVMRYAAWLWAAARNAGTSTAPKEALDGDAILAAHALLAGDIGDRVTIAKTNLGHLCAFPGVVAAVLYPIA